MGRDYRKVRMFHVAYGLVLEMYKFLKHYPDYESRNICDQIRRAATSIPLNIVEGISSTSNKVYLNHLGYAYGSARELGILLELSKDLKYLDVTTFKLLDLKLNQLKAGLYKLMCAVDKEVRKKLKNFTLNYKSRIKAGTLF